MSQVSIIDIEGNHPQIPTRFDANVGFAIPIGNVLEILGDVVPAGTTPVQTVGSGNTITTNVQLSQAILTTDATRVGLSAFNSSHFAVDANGFVSLAGGGAGVDSFAMQTGLTPVVPNGIGLVTFNGAVVAAGTNPVRTDGTGANTMALEVQISQAIAAADATKVGLSNYDSSSFAVDANGFVTASSTGLGKTITGNTGGALSPTAGNWNIPGNNTALNGFASYSTGSGSTLTINSFGRNIWVVNPTSGVGTHTTIQAAVTAASAGDTVVVTAKSTAYTENITAKAGVNIVADTADAFTPNVTIAGTITHNTAGTVSISGIRLQTNSAAAIAVTGSAASILNIRDCYLNFTNNTGITFSSSSGSARININNSIGDLGTTGISPFSHSSSGGMTITDCRFTNSGGSSTEATCSAGVLDAFFMNMNSPVTFSGTGAGTWEHCLIDCSPQNVTAMTLGGSGIQSMKWTRFNSGSASAVSIGTTANLQFCTVNSTNTNAITGAGTLQSSLLSFDNTSSTINTTTQTPLTNRFGIERSTTQPAFLAFATTQSNVTGDNTNYNVTFNTEIFDQNSNFDAVSTFTAPVTGRYHLNTDLIFNDVGVAHTGSIMILVTSNRSYFFNYFNIGLANFGGVQFGVQSVLADMDAADVALVTVQISGGTKIVDINALSNFSGNLVC